MYSYIVGTLQDLTTAPDNLYFRPMHNWVVSKSEVEFRTSMEIIKIIIFFNNRNAETFATWILLEPFWIWISFWINLKGIQSKSKILWNPKCRIKTFSSMFWINFLYHFSANFEHNQLCGVWSLEMESERGDQAG